MREESTIVSISDDSSDSEGKESTIVTISDDSSDSGGDNPRPSKPAFFACYLLRSLRPRCKATYIGFTVNPRRRIRQHNGEVKFRACRTKKKQQFRACRTKKKQPWEMVLCVYGFPSKVSALKVVLREDTNQSRKIKYELVQCKLTLFYDYWQMDEVLEELLPKGMVVPSSYELVGHIAHLNLRTEHLPYRRLIAQVVFDKNRPKIQTVVNKIDAIQNDYRTMQLEVLAGNHSLVTTVVENRIGFQVDLATVYWNSRLGTERQRLINSFKRGDNICDVFSGVGPLAIAAAKKVNRVYANDLNPFAVKYQLKNIACNKLRGKVEVFNKDGREFIKEILGRENPVFVTQVVMNLPNDAAEYLDAFRGVFREEHRDMHLPLPTIHVYGFSKAPEPELEFLERIGSALGEAPTAVDMHRVRLVAPGKWMLCATFSLPKRVAFAS